MRHDGPAPTPPDIKARLKRAPPGGGGPGGGGRGGGGLGGLNYVVSPPTVERPPLATDFNRSGTLAGRTVATSPSQFTDADFEVPANNVAVIRAISILANALLISSDIFWSLRFNARNVQGWNELRIAPRAAGSLEFSWTPGETFIPVPEGVQISFTNTVIDGGTYQLSVTYHGWFYPTSVEAAARGAYGG